MGFGRGFFFFNTAQTGVLAQADDQFGEICVADATLELPIECVCGRLQQRVLVDVFDGLEKFRIRR